MEARDILRAKLKEYARDAERQKRWTRWNWARQVRWAGVRWVRRKVYSRRSQKKTVGEAAWNLGKCIGHG